LQAALKKRDPHQVAGAHNSFEGFTTAGTGKLFAPRLQTAGQFQSSCGANQASPGKKLAYALWRVYLEELAFPNQLLVLRPFLSICIESLASLIHLKFIEQH